MGCKVHASLHQQRYSPPKLELVKYTKLILSSSNLTIYVPLNLIKFRIN